ncbi:hypothetical protein MJO28_016957 [Puccinia striiformis f. sp. tritici]|uniref:Uncharacterized protein n=3 Tax=Puccinia striiformis TaxID=27350 RepID=A0A0L0VHK7_9BASI|nr:hypothetical protein Pst134EB_006062 [Puccinia striiformis f. sp. tritici]KAI7934530.1 hypothetical protein MJO28_016957 [Puccinia striiformis f. sp. tritici]KNE98711.1 hypothetical protein PSTG_08079 [Puccinia striiformis f. sp. tritici PST-78]POW04997.1 hypothetical protein PSTT_09995 [Puccinia striiformis]POW21601.1 hypothetical protein PSHT_02137 [Puccinia striiformis]
MDAQSSKLPCFQDNGKPPTDRRRLNILFSNILPKSTSLLCPSIYSLNQTLLDLNLEIPPDGWKLGPSLEKLNTVSSYLTLFYFTHSIPSRQQLLTEPPRRFLPFTD